MREPAARLPWSWTNIGRELQQDHVLTAKLEAALAREAVLLRAQTDLLLRHDMLAQEFDHRLMNSLQLIVGMLSLQIPTAGAEAAAQLTIAAGRVAAFGRVHRQLHLLDHRHSVELQQYLQQLCEDLSSLLFNGQADHAIAVEGAKIEVPTAVAIPLGFIVNELITNAAKYATGGVTVRLEATITGSYLISVGDNGPGFPIGFSPADSKGLGMRIVRSLVKQIGGTLRLHQGDHGRGASVTIAFEAPMPQIPVSAEHPRLQLAGTRTLR